MKKLGVSSFFFEKLKLNEILIWNQITCKLIPFFKAFSIIIFFTVSHINFEYQIEKNDVLNLKALMNDKKCWVHEI